MVLQLLVLRRLLQPFFKLQVYSDLLKYHMIRLHSQFNSASASASAT